MASYLLTLTIYADAGQKNSAVTEIHGSLVGVMSSHRDTDPLFNVDFAVEDYHITHTPVDVRTFSLTDSGGMKVPCMFRAPLPKVNASLIVSAYNVDPANAGSCNLTFLVEM